MSLVPANRGREGAGETWAVLSLMRMNVLQGYLARQVCLFHTGAHTLSAQRTDRDKTQPGGWRDGMGWGGWILDGWSTNVFKQGAFVRLSVFISRQTQLIRRLKPRAAANHPLTETL